MSTHSHAQTQYSVNESRQTHYSAIIDEHGQEVLITEQMIQQACQALEQETTQTCIAD